VNFLNQPFKDPVPLEKERKHSDLQRQADLGLISLGLVHEIRNILSGLNPWVEMFPSKREDGKFLDNFEAVALGQTRRLIRLTDEVLAFSKNPGRNFEPLDLNGIATQVTRLFAPLAKDQEVKVVLQTAEIPQLRGNRTQIESLVMNLFQNALQAAGKKGKISVKTRFHSKTKAGSPAWAEISVQNSGPVIPQEKLSRIFEPFFTSKESGTGLGLWICQVVAADHKGRLEVASRKGKGTTFRAFFPITFK
jgi:signal transduction histidine kinase